MKKLICVTRKDIRDGARRDCAGCPIALAMTRAFGQRIFVGRALFDVGSGNTELPAVAKRFIEDFDDSKPVNSFRFTVEY